MWSELAGLPTGVTLAFFGVLGLLIGSFLNVVIHRLPLMMEAGWKNDCAELLGVGCSGDKTVQPGDQGVSADTLTLTLSKPRSRCPHCQHLIAWYENIPVLSWLFLRARCSSCQAPISWRYPAVEVLTAACFATVAWRYGATAATLAWCCLVAFLIAMAFIDWDTTLLPDSLTLPMVWLGLVATQMGWTGISLPTALWGAVMGYMSLWSICAAFTLITGRVGMGNGDFKLLAVIGAWLGWMPLIAVVLGASFAGILVWIVLKIRKDLREGDAMPFGPLLILGGVAQWVSPTQLF